MIDYLESQGGSASAGDIRKQVMSAGLTWKTVQNNRRKWGVKTEQRADGWIWSLEVGPAGTSRTRGGRDLGCGQVDTHRSGPGKGQVPHPTHEGPPRDVTGRGTVPDLSSGDTEDTSPAVRSLPDHRGITPGPRGREDDPTEEVTLSDHVQDDEPTVDTADTEKDIMARAAVLEALAEFPQTVEQISKSVTLTYRRRTADILATLVSDGKADDHGDGTYSSP